MALSKPLRLHKPRFRDWLVDILDENLSEDAKWVDRENAIAVILWPHKSQGNWSLEKDAKLFEMWAVRSGKHRHGEHPNPKSWKCNFRMNLNICKNITEIKGRRIPKGVNARRFFKFLDKGQYQNSFTNTHFAAPFPDCAIDPTVRKYPAHTPNHRNQCRFSGTKPAPDIVNQIYNPDPLYNPNHISNPFTICNTNDALFEGLIPQLSYQALPHTNPCNYPDTTPQFPETQNSISLPIKTLNVAQLNEFADSCRGVQLPDFDLLANM